MNIQRRRLLENQFNKFKRQGKAPNVVDHKIQAQYAEWLRNNGGVDLLMEQKPDAKRNAKVESKTAKKKASKKKGLFG